MSQGAHRLLPLPMRRTECSSSFGHGRESIRPRKTKPAKSMSATESPHFYLKTQLCSKFLGTLENTKNGHKG